MYLQVIFLAIAIFAVGTRKPADAVEAVPDGCGAGHPTTAVAPGP